MPKKRYLEYAGRTDEPDIYSGNLISSKPTAGDKAASQFNTTMQNIIRKAVSANKTRNAKLKRERDAYFSKTKPVKTEKEVVLNDNTWVDNGRIKNPENKERSVKGGLANAAWVADNPIKSTIGQIAGIAPFGVMAYPVLAEAGVAAAPALVGNPYVDAALTSIFAGHGLNHLFNEGIDGYGDAAMTALELTPLGKLAKPMIKSAIPYYNASKTYLQNKYPAIFDPYTSWDATLGYHGDNIFSRAIGTVGRRFGYTPKAEIPEFHRRLNITKPESFRLTDDGKFIMSSGRTGEGHEGIVNFATSEPARSHNKHKYLSGVDDFIVSPKAFEGVDFKSIQPSDTFFEMPLSNTEFAVDPKYITFVSGEPEALDFARSIGMKTLSSPRLRALESDRPTFSGLLSRINNFKGAHSEHARSIGNEIQRLTSMRGAPTMKDYAHFEDVTGLNSGVVPASRWTGTNEIDLFGRKSGVRGVPIFNNVAYDPATSIESIYRKAKTGEGTWEAYYDALEKMPSARQQLGLNSAQQTEATAPQITAKNAASITPEQWTAAQDAAIARGDMVEAQRLRDLHFKVSAHNTQIVDKNGNPLHTYHGGQKGITAFLNPNEFDANIKLNNYYRNGRNRIGIYTSDWESYAKQYARGYKKKDRTVYDLYVNMENPRHISYTESQLNRLKNLNPFRKKDYLNPSVIRPEHKEQLLSGYDGVKWDVENVVFDGKQLKSADAVTFNDKGVRIPLGERDNFNINDIRYSWLPWLLGGISATTLYNTFPMGRTVSNITTKTR